MLYQLVHVDEDSERLVRKRARVSGCSSVFACLAVLFFFLSSALPMWVVTSFRGQGHVGVLDFSVNMNVGDGLWLRNVCFGSHPSEELLNKAGLTCDGTLQTAGCADDDLTDKQQEHCARFVAAQALETLAVVCATAAWLVGLCMSTHRGRFSPALFSLLAASAASGVFGALSETYMFTDREDFACANVLGANLCRGYGAALNFHVLALVACLTRVMMELRLACLPPAPEGGAIVVATQVPLLHAEYVRLADDRQPMQPVQVARVVPQQAVRAEAVL